MKHVVTSCSSRMEKHLNRMAKSMLKEKALHVGKITIPLHKAKEDEGDETPPPQVLPAPLAIHPKAGGSLVRARADSRAQTPVQNLFDVSSTGSNSEGDLPPRAMSQTLARLQGTLITGMRALSRHSELNPTDFGSEARIFSWTQKNAFDDLLVFVRAHLIMVKCSQVTTSHVKSSQGRSSDRGQRAFN